MGSRFQVPVGVSVRGQGQSLGQVLSSMVRAVKASMRRVNQGWWAV